MARVELPVVRPRFGATMRTDAWWVQTPVVLLPLIAYIVYATWAAFQGKHYTYGPYLSPFYAPELFGDSHHAWFGPKPGWWPGWMPFSPALLILPFPGLFRLTCYYYRGMYYKAFVADPPACAVGEPRARYGGETKFPLLLQNLHRYALYIALVFLVLLAYDVWKAMWFTDPATGRTSFGIGVGTLVLLVNVLLLGSYTLGCHSMRHLTGGYLDRMSRSPTRKKLYDCSSCLNREHMRWAWLSLCSVGFADLYVRLCSMGIWTDWRIF
jgi:hypothetical protein